MESFNEQDRKNIDAVFSLAILQLANNPNGVDKNGIYQALVLEAKLNKFIDENSTDTTEKLKKKENNG